MLVSTLKRILSRSTKAEDTVTVNDKTAALLQRGIIEGNPLKYLSGTPNAERVKNFLRN
jgi:hypothetical protein